MRREVVTVARFSRMVTRRGTDATGSARATSFGARVLRAAVPIAALAAVTTGLTVALPEAVRADVPPAERPATPSAPTARVIGPAVRLRWTIPVEVLPADVTAVRIGERELVPVLTRPATTRIVGGEDASIAEVPWQARLQVVGGEDCGGTIIDPEWVITAAHCFEGSPADAAVLVWTGVTRRQQMTEANAIPAAEVILHPSWNSVTNANDLALIRLESPIAAGTPIRLFGEKGPRKGTPAIISGWGATGSATHKHRLQRADVTVLAGPRQSCGNYGSLFDPTTMLCAGSIDGTVDTCQGDSGGPLVTVIDERLELAGITSFGLECAERGYPGVYTRVSTYVGWIHAQLGYDRVRTVPCQDSSCTHALVDKLTPGTGYVFRVALVNAEGSGRWSPPSAPVEISNIVLITSRTR